MGAAGVLVPRSLLHGGVTRGEGWRKTGQYSCSLWGIDYSGKWLEGESWLLPPGKSEQQGDDGVEGVLQWCC